MRNAAEFEQFMSTTTHEGAITLSVQLDVTDAAAFKAAFDEGAVATRKKQGCQIVGILNGKNF